MSRADRPTTYELDDGSRSMRTLVLTLEGEQIIEAALHRVRL